LQKNKILVSLAFLKFAENKILVFFSFLKLAENKIFVFSAVVFQNNGPKPVVFQYERSSQQKSTKTLTGFSMEKYLSKQLF